MSTFLTRINNYENDDKKNKPTSSDKIKLFIIVFILTSFCVIYAMKDKEKFDILKKDFLSLHFLIIFFIIFIIICVGLVIAKKRIKSAIIYGTISFITAYLGHLNMSFAVFFIVSLFAYYMHRNETID